MMPDEQFGSGYVIRNIQTKVDTLADKFDTLAGKSEVAFLSARMDSMVPRSEHEVHWKLDELQRKNMSDRLESIEKKVDDLIADRIPRWMLPALGVVAPVLVALASHFWK